MQIQDLRIGFLRMVNLEGFIYNVKPRDYLTTSEQFIISTSWHRRETACSDFKSPPAICICILQAYSSVPAILSNCSFHCCLKYFSLIRVKDLQLFTFILIHLIFHKYSYQKSRVSPPMLGLFRWLQRIFQGKRPTQGENIIQCPN